MAYQRNLRWEKVTKTFADFATNGVTNNITIYTLPAKGMIHSVMIVPTVAFSGGLLATYTLSVGIAGTLAKYCLATNVFTGFTLPTPSLLTGVESMSGTTAIKGAAISTVANLDQASAGTVDIFLLVSELP